MAPVGFLYLIGILLVAGVLLWGVNAIPAIDATIKQIIKVIVIVVVAIYVIWFLIGVIGAAFPHPLIH